MPLAFRLPKISDTPPPFTLLIVVWPGLSKLTV